MRTGATRRRREPPRTPGGPDVVTRERINRAFLALALGHELKQPLHSLNLNVELLSKRLGRTPGLASDVAGPLQALGRVVDRMTGCLETFGARVLPEPVPTEPRDIKPLVSEAVERAAAGARRGGVRVQAAFAPDVPPLPVHPDQLAVALDALLDNAVRATPAGGEVTAAVRRAGDEVYVEVSDGGEGMSAEMVRRAAEIGYSTHGGDGIGITVAKFIAYHHAGGFHLDSHPGEGTRACIVLPVTQE